MSKRKKPIGGLSRHRKPKPIPGFPGYFVCNDGSVYQKLEDGYQLMNRYIFDKHVYVKLDWKKVEVWRIVCLAYGLGNPDVLDVIYGPLGYKNPGIKNLSFVPKSTGGRSLQFKPAEPLGDATSENIADDPWKSRDVLIRSTVVTPNAKM